MVKRERIEIEGVIKEALPAASFKAELSDGREALVHASGKMRRYHIRILLGDRVKIELSPYDETRGRIVYRYK